MRGLADGEALGDLGSGVGAAVLGQDELVVDALGFHLPDQLGDLGLEALGLVVDGDDHRVAGRVGRLRHVLPFPQLAVRLRLPAASVSGDVVLLERRVPEGQVPAAEEVPHHGDDGGYEGLALAGGERAGRGPEPEQTEHHDVHDERRQVHQEEEAELAPPAPGSPGAERPVLVPDEAVDDAQQVGDGLGRDVGHPGMNGEQHRRRPRSTTVLVTPTTTNRRRLSGRAVAAEEPGDSGGYADWKSRAIC